MKTRMLFITGATLLFLAGSTLNAEAQHSLYRSGEFSLDLFGTGSIGQQTIDQLTGARIRHDIRLGAGAGLNYFTTRLVGFGVEAYSENPRHSLVDDTSLNLILRFPLGSTGLAPYGLAGGGRQFDPTQIWHAQLGAGLECRLNPKVGLFIDGRYVMGDGGKNYGLGRAGLRLSF
jgi:hypothetical protein